MCKQCNSLNKANNNPLTTDHEPPRCEAVGKCDCCGQAITAEMLDDGGAIEAVNGIHFCSAECANEMNYWPCEYCGGYIDNDRPEVVASNCGRYTEWYAYCSEDCAEADGCFKCDTCGEWYRDANHEYRISILYNGHEYEYCDTDCARNDGLEICEYCGEWEEDEGIFLL